MDLYQILGIRKNASPKRIHAAYRLAAKKAHPDAGGTVEDFNLIKLARDVLSDPIKRKIYDDTGEIGEAKPNDKYSKAIQEIATAVNGIMQDCLARNIDPLEQDFHRDLVFGFKSVLMQVKIELERRERAKKIYLSMVGKFEKTTEDENVPEHIFDAMMMANARLFEQQAEHAAAHRDRLELVLELLTKYRFLRKETKAPGVAFFGLTASPFSSATSTS